MNSNITFELATLDDAKRLLACRNDELTRKASFNTAIVSYQEHHKWLQSTLKDHTIKLHLAYFKDDFIGTIRSNTIDNDTSELSWSLMPDARGKGLAKDMLYLFTSRVNTNIVAQIKKENLVSCKVAEFIGMHLEDEKDEILLYKKFGNSMKQNVLIFGTGIAGRAIYRKIKSSYNVVGFLENNKRLVGEKYENINIFHVDSLTNKDYDLIALSGIWAKEMLTQLQNIGISKNKILHIPDNTIDFSGNSRVENTDLLVKLISDVFKKENIDSYVIGSSLATLFRNKDLSCVADVDLFLYSQDDANKFYKEISDNDLFKAFEIQKLLYAQDDVLAKKNEIKKIVISSKINTPNEEKAIIDINIAYILGDNYILSHGTDYIYIPVKLCEGKRYYNYKNIQLQIAKKSEEYLCLLYGEDWITPPSTWSQSDYGNLLSFRDLKNQINME